MVIVNDTIVRRIKKDLRKAVPGLKSMHVDEAIARGLGARTYAALLAGFEGDQYELVVDVHAHRFLGFMIGLGYEQATVETACQTFQSLAARWGLPDASAEGAQAPRAPGACAGHPHDGGQGEGDTP